ncbi:hypothetical protein WBG99_00520 [Streptomyces sp. TG1A-60]|uniref:hypothetical protein n=1 Tax=Streptomyces sp. TG1A-60 TaxID=3129111 RepID=UPI0030D51628
MADICALRWAEDCHDRLDLGAAFGELGADGVAKPVGGHGGIAVAVDEPGLAAGDLQGVRVEEVTAHGLAPPHEHVADRPLGPCVMSGCGVRCLGRVDQLAQGVRCLGVQGDHALGVGLADRDPQPRIAVGVGVQAVQGQPCDLPAPGAAPAQQKQGGTLVRVFEFLDRFHEAVQLGPGDEPRQCGGEFGHVRAAEQGSARDVAPAPLAGLAEELKQRAEVGIAGPCRQRPSGPGVDVLVQVGYEALDVPALQLGHRVDVGVGLGEPAQEVNDSGARPFPE